LTDEIPLIPDLPSGLREAAVRGRLIPFVGAGASMIAGCPNWTEFANRSLQFFIDQGTFTHSQLDQIKNLHPRVKLTLALSLERQHKTRIDFRRVLYPDGRQDNPKGRRLYASLSYLAKTFVTTNYDEWLDKEIGTASLSVAVGGDATPGITENVRSVIYKVDDLTAVNLNRPNTVIHLHGSILDPNNMILTTRDYVRHYANDRMSEAARENIVLTFLEDLFRQKTVLFVGYGLEELEILEYAISKARLGEGDGAKEIRHYLLQGFFSHEYEVMKSLSLYYLECGIQLIPFLRDQKNWDQLIDVLEAFGKQAPASEPMKLEKLSQMEGLLNG
jgi:hypothetical protein